MFGRLKTGHTPVSHAFRMIEPAWRDYIGYARMSAQKGNEDMKRFLESYDALPAREKRNVMPEKVCDLSAVEPSTLIGCVSQELWMQKQSESVITASMSHPRVVEATATFAQHPLGGRDRELFFKMTGTLPDQKKGTSIVINTTPQVPGSGNTPLSAGANGFRPMNQRVIEMSRILDDNQEDAEVVPINTDDDVLDEGDESED